MFTPEKEFYKLLFGVKYFTKYISFNTSPRDINLL